MGTSEIREPVQKRSIEKKEKIIKAGFELICDQGYHNTNTAEIAKRAGVSTGIVYQYFEDKHDILIQGLEKYGDNVFSPIPLLPNKRFDKDDLPKILKKIITSYVKDHKLSESAHEEITAMTHSDKDVSNYFYSREMEMTENMVESLKNNGYDIENLDEKVHIIIGLIDNLCHEVVYHKHKNMDYTVMTNIVIDTIMSLLN